MRFKINVFDSNVRYGPTVVDSLDAFFLLYPEDFMLSTQAGVRIILSNLQVGDQVGLEYNHYIKVRVMRIKDLTYH